MTTSVAAKQTRPKEVELIIFCGKCGAVIGKGQIPQPRMHGVCPACATIFSLEVGTPFAIAADLKAVPLRDRAGLEQKAQEVRRARGIRPTVTLD